MRKTSQMLKKQPEQHKQILIRTKKCPDLTVRVFSGIIQSEQKNVLIKKRKR